MRMIMALVMGLAAPVVAQDVSLRPPSRPAPAGIPGDAVGFSKCLTRVRNNASAAGINAAVSQQALAAARFEPDVLRRDARQSEFTKTIWDYLSTAVSKARVANGRKALAGRADLLARIEMQYGVEQEIVTAIWGLESAYGAVRGSIPTISALATLACASRRGAFFEDQLLAGLTILQDGDVQPRAMVGSWAGAMGHTQFMPRSFLDHAVDATGDGRRDIWGDDPADALASTAAYLKAQGWETGQPWGREVRLPKGFDYLLADRRVLKTPGDWAALGVLDVVGRPVPDFGPASILLPAGASGAAFMIFDNFEVLEHYNTADAYVIAVGHLADRIGGGAPLAGGWPLADRALSFEERIALQKGLRAAGFDPHKIDGRIGPLTIQAVRAFQQANKLVPDGYASPALLERVLR